MAFRECDKCGEMVAEAKAFCPGCGNAFVEEEAPKTTAFQKLDHTVQFGQTMYNQMLEDMGLNISEAPASNESRIEVIKPLEPERLVPSAKISEGAPVKQEGKIADKPRTSSNVRAYFFGALAGIILFPIALISAILLFLDIWSRWFR